MTPRGVRGGAFPTYSWLVRAACRLGFVPDYRDHHLGFRVVVSPIGVKPQATVAAWQAVVAHHLAIARRAPVA